MSRSRCTSSALAPTANAESDCVGPEPAFESKDESRRHLMLVEPLLRQIALRMKRDARIEINDETAFRFMEASNGRSHGVSVNLGSRSIPTAPQQMSEPASFFDQPVRTSPCHRHLKASQRESWNELGALKGRHPKARSVFGFGETGISGERALFARTPVAGKEESLNMEGSEPGKSRTTAEADDAASSYPVVPRLQDKSETARLGG